MPRIRSVARVQRLLAPIHGTIGQSHEHKTSCSERGEPKCAINELVTLSARTTAVAAQSADGGILATLADLKDHAQIRR